MIVMLLLAALLGTPFIQSGVVTGGGVAVGPGMRVATHCIGHDIVSTYNGENGAYWLEIPGRVCVTQAWSVRGEYTSGPVLFVAGGDVSVDLDLRRPAIR